MTNSSSLDEGEAVVDIDYAADYYDYLQSLELGQNEGYRKAEKYIWVVGGSILLALGTVGNLLALFVLTRPKLRKSKPAMYLMVVAVVDLAALYTGLLRQILYRATGTDIREHSEWGCRLHTFSVYFFLDLSAWLLAAMSLERLFTIYRPFTARRRCTRMTSVSVIVAIVITLFAVNCHFFFTTGDLVHTVGNMTFTVRCSPLSLADYQFVTDVWPWVDLSVFALLPLALQTVSNALIVKAVMASFRSARRSRGHGQGHGSGQGNVQGHSQGHTQGHGRGGCHSQGHYPNQGSCINVQGHVPGKVDAGDQRLDLNEDQSRCRDQGYVQGQGYCQEDIGRSNSGSITVNYVESLPAFDSGVGETSEPTVEQESTMKDNASGAVREKPTVKSESQRSNARNPSMVSPAKGFRPKPTRTRRRKMVKDDEQMITSMTMMLVTVSVVFCLTTLPISIYTIVNWILVKQGDQSHYAKVAWAILYVLMYANNAVNFLLYTLSGSRFRAQLTSSWVALCKRVPRRRHAASAMTSHSMTSSRTDTSERSVVGRRWSSVTEVSSVRSSQRRKSEVSTASKL